MLVLVLEVLAECLKHKCSLGMNCENCDDDFLLLLLLSKVFALLGTRVRYRANNSLKYNRVERDLHCYLIESKR